jgi:CHAD domain-containing protein
MASSAIAAHPVRTLHELFTALEAAVAATLADPNPKAVHRLRTTTRRIEAQLELLSLLPDLPEHARPKAKTQKLLKQLRRAAGRVRDLDVYLNVHLNVQRKLAQSRSPRLHPEIHQLQSSFKRQRGEESEDLLRILHRHQAKIARRFKTLLKALAPAETLALPISRLMQLTLGWYLHNIPTTANSSGQLHTIRKAAKLARYMAESATPTAKSPRTPAARLALTFESLQQSGGIWHDWLILSRIARRELGPSSPLSELFASNCEESLASYQRELESLPRALSTALPTSKKTASKR